MTSHYGIEFEKFRTKTKLKRARWVAVLGLGAFVLTGCRAHQAATDPYAAYAKPIAMPFIEAKICGDPRLDGATIAPFSKRGGRCGAREAVELRSVSGVAISPPATVTCAVAAGLADLIDNGVAPAAEAHLGAAVVEIKNVDDYSCRKRRNGVGRKWSEHASANALDISAFKLADGREITLLKGWRAQGGAPRFLRAVWKAGCEAFNTVLGPDSNRYHRDHFHFDQARRRSGRYCR